MVLDSRHKMSEFESIPGRVFLDTCVVNLLLDYGEQIHDCVDVPDSVTDRMRRDIEALRMMFRTGARASWQLAVSPYTYREVISTRDPQKAGTLDAWFCEIWHYWRQFLHSSDDLPSFSEAEDIRLANLASGVLDVLPDVADRTLVCDALVYRCDAFCTRDWSTILRFREGLSELPIRILTPAEWWDLIRPWAELWL